MNVIQTFSLYLSSKILSGKNRCSLLELFLVGLLCVLSIFIYQFMGVYGAILLIFSIFLINCYVQKNNLYAAGITAYAAIITVFSDHFATMFEVHLLSINNSSITLEYIVRHLSISTFLSFLICYAVLKLTNRIEGRFELDIKNNLFFIVIGVITMIVYHISVFLGVSLGNSVNLIQLNLLFFIGYLIATLVIFFFYVNSLRNKYEIKQKEIEYESMRQYTESMEKQYQEIRKFRHDYKNILTSLDDYILENDYDGLKNYYMKKIKPSSENISRNDFKLDNLANVKIRELKSLLAFKLISAQEAGIDTIVEVKEPIETLSIDSIILVRTMGIILDNAIEEVETLKEGTIAVALFEDSKAAQIIVQNTCRKDMPKIHQLKKEGFSTKGNDRGLGLSNMRELINKCDNAMLETTIENDYFIQRLIINK